MTFNKLMVLFSSFQLVQYWRVRFPTCAEDLAILALKELQSRPRCHRCFHFLQKTSFCSLVHPNIIQNPGKPSCFDVEKITCCSSPLIFCKEGWTARASLGQKNGLELVCYIKNVSGWERQKLYLDTLYLVEICWNYLNSLKFNRFSKLGWIMIIVSINIEFIITSKSASTSNQRTNPSTSQSRSHVGQRLWAHVDSKP